MCICIIFMHSDHPGSYSRTCHFSMKQLAPCFSERRPLSKADSKTWAVFPAMSRDVEQSSGRTGSSLATSTVGKWVSIRVKKKHDIYARPKEIWRLLDVQKLGLQPTPSTSKVLQLRSPFNRIGSWDHSGWSFATCWLLETNLLRKEHFLVRLSRKPQRLQDQHLSACQNHDLRWSSLTSLAKWKSVQWIYRALKPRPNLKTMPPGWQYHFCHLRAPFLPCLSLAECQLFM